MRKVIAKGTDEFQMHADYFRLCEDFAIPEESDEYWESLIKAIDNFTKQYPFPLAQQMCFALTQAKEAELKAMRAERGRKVG